MRAIMEMKRSQQGVTLISMMVGLTISLIITTGMLVVFKNVVKTTLKARESASADGKYMSSSLTAFFALQEAGYGVTSPQPGVQLMVISGATLSSNALSGTVSTSAPAAGNAAVWEILSGGVLQCAGLYSPPLGGLQSLPAVNCAGASTWSTLAWTPVILVPSPALASDSDKADRNLPVFFEIKSTTGACNPPGITTISGNVLVTLTAKNDASALYPYGYSNLSTSQCLTNFLLP